MNQQAFEAARSQMISDLSADLSGDAVERRKEMEAIDAALRKTYDPAAAQQDWVDAATAEAKIGL
jgi:hypothetical protein